MRSSRSLLLLVMAAFAAVTVSFLAALAVSHQSASEIDKVTDDITDNASPSVSRVAELRKLLWGLQQQLMEARVQLAEHKRPDLTGAVRSLDEIDRAWAGYLSMPVFPGEPELQGRARSDLLQVKSLIRRIARTLAQGDAREASTIIDSEAKETFARTADDLLEVIRLNQTFGHAAAVRIDGIRKQSSRLALSLGALALLITVALAWLVAWNMRKLARLQAEHQRFQEERTQELEFFAARVAHDIRSPLAGAMLLCDRATRGTPSADDLKRLVNRTHSTLQRMSRMVDDLYEFARASVQSDRGAHTSLREAVRLALEDAGSRASEAGISITQEEIPECDVAATPGVVSSILSNLLNNALKYAGNGAHITVRASAGEVARVEVSDTGPGIAPELQARIFQPYSRGAQKTGEGLGLGLATVRRLVEGHGGRSGVRSRLGAGSTFWFELPLVPREEVSSCPPALPGVRAQHQEPEQDGGEPPGPVH